ncbi:hypothetical protein RHS01_04694 [Rhizoctonia solani]|uniref:Uncharacterized protein n=1 Tax=Rhizoctonia solani TaxID=456999 RepID=A0A8H7M252_9AGAM|nr:hypothetical protein RHS01_04694 [Rhizoctonia solani]
MDKKGLDQATFQDLLAANRERSSKRMVSPADRLRREVVVKAHHSKQFERRALFLSKIIAPPSPTSTETAVTPPESPAIFHFSLPSPGLASPLELFENVASREHWIEEVDYNKKSIRTPARDAFPAGRLPSLDQITARLRPSLNGGRIQASSRIPNSIIASARARSTSPPTPVAQATPACDVPSKLIISSSPPKSIKPVLVPQSIPALRINKASGPELAPVPVMSWRQREVARSPVAKEHMQAESWRRDVPTKKDLVRDAVVSPGDPPEDDGPPTRGHCGFQDQTGEGISTMDVSGLSDAVPAIRRSALPRAQRDVSGSECRAVQGRNMLDKLRRRTSAPAQLEGVMRKGIPVGGF